MTEAVLERARAGDEHAFGELVDPFKGELRVHCYRILASLTDAEDMVQETLVAAWRGLHGLSGFDSLRPWLYRIATNRCLNALRAAKSRRPPEPVAPFDPTEPTRRSEITWLQPYPDALLDEAEETAPGPAEQYAAKETISLAFIAGLQRLAPRQAAVLVLRDVLDFPLADVAATLAVTETAAKGTLQRARATLARHRGGAEPALPVPGTEEQDLARRFADALIRDDIEGVVALLTNDAWLAMPPAPHEYHGHAPITAFLRSFAAYRADRRFHLEPTRANRQPAFGCYIDRPGEQTADAAGIFVLTLAEHRIGGVTWFLDDDVRRRFGLAATVPTTPSTQLEARRPAAPPKRRDS